MPACPVCQKDNPQGVEYCEDCGASLQGDGVVAPVENAAAVGATNDVPAPQASGATDINPAAGGSAVAEATESDAAAPAATAEAPAAEGGVAPSAPSDTGGGGPRLVVKRHGASTGEQIQLLGERLLVGRFDPETGPVDLDLSASPEAQHISRQHAELYREADGRWFVRDLGSTNGVFVRDGTGSSFGPRITAPRELAPGDEVAFGNARFIFQTD